jgi:hypothetical protein
MFLILALDEDEWSASAALPPWIMSPVSMEWKAGWVPEPRRKILYVQGRIK